MIILGIETSCDETAAAIVQIENNKTNILASVVATSEDLHKKTGGIVPENAAREQVNSIIPVICNCFEKANINFKQIDAITVTYGPGLIGSLLVGVETAKTLAMVWNKPLIPINHLKAHLYACFLDKNPEFPAIGLVVSGGHTDFVYMESHSEIKHIGGTRDDAAGEAFDKTARLLGLPYPGGPAISKKADKYFNSVIASNRSNLKKDRHGSTLAMTGLDLFPRPMINSGDLDMSFSGLKTAVLNYVKKNSNFDVSHLAAEIQEAIVDTIVKKSIFAVEKYKPKSFLIAGGVSANKRLRTKLQEVHVNSEDVHFYVPQPQLTTDNAVMIAIAANYMQQNISWKNVNANPNLGIEE